MMSFECRPATVAADLVPTVNDPGSAAVSLPDVPRQRSTRANQRITALGEMTAGLAHDFRNILTIIESGLALAGRSRHDPEKAQAALDAVHDGIRRGIRLTSQLVVFARPEKPEVHPQSVNDLLSGLKTFLKYGAGPGIRIDLALSPGLPPCPIDPPQFNAAVLNLVINARDAMPQGGQIGIETDLWQSPGGETGAPTDRFVRVRIVDEGCGMPPEVVEHLFDPYFTTKGDAGTGLGMPQVAAFMRSSGGTVRVDTEPGAGTTFELLFPADDHREPIGGNLWPQLDRWINEGGSPDPVEAPRSRRCEIAPPAGSAPPRGVRSTALPAAPGNRQRLRGTHRVGRDQ